MTLASEIEAAGYTDYWFASRLRKELCAAQSNLCAICGDPMEPTATTIDHVWPRGKRGYCGPGNFVGAHKWCNHAKGNSYPHGCEIIWLVVVNARLGFTTQLTT